MEYIYTVLHCNIVNYITGNFFLFFIPFRFATLFAKLSRGCSTPHPEVLDESRTSFYVVVTGISYLLSYWCVKVCVNDKKFCKGKYAISIAYIKVILSYFLLPNMYISQILFLGFYFSLTVLFFETWRDLLMVNIYMRKYFSLLNLKVKFWILFHMHKKFSS